MTSGCFKKSGIPVGIADLGADHIKIHIQQVKYEQFI